MNYFKNNKVLLLVITALILVNIALLYFGFTDKGEPKKPMMTPVERMKRTEEKLRNEVGFNDDQIKQYEQLRQKHFDSIHPKFEDLEKIKESFLDLVYQNSLSDSAIQAGSAKICEEQRSIDEQMLRHFVSLRQLATEEQRPKMDSFLQRIIKRMIGKGPGPDREKK